LVFRAFKPSYQMLHVGNNESWLSDVNGVILG
jgi:hypothetical protein